MRLKKCVLSFLRKLVRDEISFMSDGSAFQARVPAMKKGFVTATSLTVTKLLTYTTLCPANPASYPQPTGNESVITYQIGLRAEGLVREHY